MGRWRSGAPVDLSPTADDPALGADPHRNNNFNYAHFGSNLINDQSSCPFSAHVRKARPRTDLLNLNVFNQAIRAGIPFGLEVTPDESSSGTTSELRGLAFGMFVLRMVRFHWLNVLSFLVEYQSSISYAHICDCHVYYAYRLLFRNGFRFQQRIWMDTAK